MSIEDADLILSMTQDDDYTERWGYFTGPQPAVYITPKLERVFGTLASRMGERNYCSLAVKARLARLQVEGWDGPDADAAQEVWEQSRLPQRQDRLYRWALAYGRAYLVVDGEERIIVPNKPTLVAAVEDLDDPEQYRVAGKVWQTQDEKGRQVVTCWLWYADRSEHWRQVENTWEFVGEERQPLGQVPVVEANPFGDGPVLLDTLMPSQDRLNKIGSNKMVAAEFAAFRQRVFFTRQPLDNDTMQNSPDTAILLDPGEEDWRAAVQELDATPLSNYDDSKDSEIRDLMTLASLPRHMMVNPGSPPSGDAITADEGPLVEDVRDHQRELGEALVAAMGLLDIDAEPVWRDPEVNDDLSNAQQFALLAPQVGWRMAAKQVLGWTDEMVAEAEQSNQPIPGGSPVGADLLAQAEQP